jgi:glycosyltransferase involved in cell wall biosynthesis
MPVFSDWDTAAVLCQRIDDCLLALPWVDTHILIVDDGSPNPMSGWIPFQASHIRKIDVLLLRRNMGHQRAIAAGLCFIHDEISCDEIVVMDSDGEDLPEDVVRLINCAREFRETVIFAERRKRLEGLVFRAGYLAYRVLHRVLTGVIVKAGNFSVLRRTALTRLVTMSELWNHYAGAIYKSKLEYSWMPTNRGRRLGGSSHMTVAALVSHGLAGIATFYELVATRILIATVGSLVALGIAFTVVVAIRTFTTLAIPGWATYTTGLLLILMLQFVTISFSLVFSLITTRSTMTVVPARDYKVFVDSLVTLWSRPQ